MTKEIQVEMMILTAKKKMMMMMKAMTKIVASVTKMETAMLMIIVLRQLTTVRIKIADEKILTH
jgi:hypothetical protein